MIIYIAFPLTEPEKNIVKQGVLPSDVLIWSQDIPKEKRFDAFMQAEVVFGNVQPGWLEKNPQLRWVQLYSAGFDQYLDLDWKGKLSHIQVTHLKGFFGIPVAETAVAGIMALYRKMDELTKLQVQKVWVGVALRPQMNVLHHKKVLILGAGAIGATTKKILEGFSCTTTMISRSSTPGLADLDNLLPAIDIVINCLPDTPETVNLLNANRLKLMQPHAVFVNVGRGTVVDEPALLKALQQAKLGGAVLDVTCTEPLPQDHALWSCPNVIITQHTGGGFREENANKAHVFVNNLKNYRSGAALENIVDFTKGY